MVGLVQILSGVALILFGVRFLREGMGRVVGPQLDVLIHRLTGRPARAFAAGLGIGAAVPSSTSVSLLLVQSFRTSRLTARAAMPMMLGADVGITALVLLSSLHITHAVPWLVVAGVGLYQFARGDRPAGAGQVLLGLALVLMGVAQIEATGGRVARQPDMVGLLAIADHYPAALAILTAALAMVLQSSTATILLVGSFGATGSLSLPLTLCVVIGANTGIALTRLIISWKLTEARRLATAGLIDRAAVLALLIPLGGALTRGMAHLPVRYGLQVALMHVGFNGLAAVLGLAGGAVMLRLAAQLVPADPADAAPRRFAPRYINGAIAADTPSLALGQAQREILRAAEIVREMLADLWQALESGDPAMAAAVSERDDEVDLLDTEVKRFLSRPACQAPDDELANEHMRQLRFLSEIEAIGDIVDKNLCELVLKKLHARLTFPEAGWRDLKSFFAKVQENMLIAETAFQTRDPKLAAQLLRHKEWLNRRYRQLSDRQLARLAAGSGETPETTAVHLDLLANLKRINSCLSHVAYAVPPTGTAGKVGPADALQIVGAVTPLPAA
jgi:phosphate:Na+ symporter